MCSVLPCVEARTEIVLIRHITEQLLTSNTGRFAALALPKSRILAYGGGDTFDATPLCAPGSVLLYCSGPARPLPFVPERLIVLDGSFRQARRMYKRVPRVAGICPSSVYPPRGSSPLGYAARRSPEGMSTIEAIAAALSELEGPELAAPLWALHAELVRRADRMRGRKREIVASGP
ncbi:MAG: DTW domain-containing protein [Pseudomonadota bacterium]